MDNYQARQLLSNFMKRLENTGKRYSIPGNIITDDEYAAMSLLSGMQEPDAEPINILNEHIGVSTRAADAKIAMNLDCLNAVVGSLPTLCLDFGTAFSKAAIWKDGASEPIVLNLNMVAGGGEKPPVESSVYISNGVVYFGPSASRRYREDNDPDRAMFTSPKELLTHQPEYIESDRPDVDVDPEQKFKSKDLLTLYLAYLTALCGKCLNDIGIKDTLARRFAAPGWHNAQIGEENSEFDAVIRKMTRYLIDAQIMANSIPFETWRDGINADDAQSLLRQMADVYDNEKWNNCAIVDRAVLEAVAASVGIEEQMVNERPQVMVIDVGAGTIDIGLFKYSLPGRGARVSPYKKGLSAFAKAGNYLDRALIALARSEANTGSDGVLERKFLKSMRDQVRDRKQELFEDHSVSIHIDGIPDITITLEQFRNYKDVKDIIGDFRAEIVATITRVGGENFTGVTAHNIVVFTGGGGGIPFFREVFDQPIQLQSGTADFLIQNSTPSWIDATDVAMVDSFPQLAVATGGCSPYLPLEVRAVSDTRTAPARHLVTGYRS